MAEEDIKKTLEHLYSEIEDAFKRKDLEAIEGHMAPEFVAHPKGAEEKDRDDLMAGLREMLANQDVLSWPRRITSLTLDGEAATTITEGLFTVSGSDGVHERMLRNVDVWEQRGDRWLMVRSHALEG